MDASRNFVLGLVMVACVVGLVRCYPRTCYEIQQSGGGEGIHEIDPDQDGLEPMAVFCNMSSSPVTAVLHHNQENWMHVDGYENKGSWNGVLVYDNGATVEEVRRLILASTRCTYFIDLQCIHTRGDYTWWDSYYGRENVWEILGGTFCQREDGTSLCRCGSNHYPLEIDQGDAGNWPFFPLIALRFGDTGGTAEYLDYIMGPLRCEQGPTFERRFQRRRGKRQTTDITTHCRAASQRDCGRACSEKSLYCLGYNFKRGPQGICEFSLVPWDAPTSVLDDDPEWDHYVIVP